MRTILPKTSTAHCHAHPTLSAHLIRRNVGTRATADATRHSQSEGVKIPTSLHEVDNGKILGFGADLAEDHPGFHDDLYKKRRVAIAKVAASHEIGSPLPEVEYTPEEISTWGYALSQLQNLFPLHACAEYNSIVDLFNFSPNEIPQLEDMSTILRKATGWQIRPVAGLMHPRDFLNGLAFKTFHSTQYVRHHSKPMYTPEPDIIHELIGHVPMLGDPAYSDLVQSIGVASLGATKKEIWHLAKAYFSTVEFGVVWESGEIKAFGAGILSSYGEMEWMASGQAELKPFDPFSRQPEFSYKDGYQKSYIALESFEDGAKKFEQYSNTILKVQLNDDGRPILL